MKSIQNECAVVTGGATGIGRATAILLAQHGAKVIVSDVNDEKGQETVALITDAGGTAHYIHCDVASQEQVKDLIQLSNKTFGPVKMAVNNAGIGGALSPIHEMSVDIWRKVLAVNLDGVFYCMQEQLKTMLASGGGSIVNIASLAGIGGTPMMSPYGVSKHGVVSLTKSAALEYASYGVRINAVCPGWTDTPILQGLGETFIKGQIDHGIPMKRLGLPEEVAESILWLLSDKSSFITGHCLNIDGGMKAR